MYIPQVIETEEGITRTFDLISSLHKDRVILLNGPVTTESAYVATMQLLSLEKQAPDEEIEFIINSPGGSVTEGMMIHDTMLKIKPKVNTVCMGQASSMGAFLLASGTGKRWVSPNCSVMIHQPLGGFRGQASDIQIHAEHMLKIKHKLNALLAKYTGQDIDKISKDTDRDNFMSAEEAIAYGLADGLIEENNG